MNMTNIGIGATYIVALLVSFITFTEGLLSSPANVLSMGIGGGIFVILCISPTLIDYICKKLNNKHHE